jgi:hypothetical protein
VSEYQFYEFLAVDRTLSVADQRALRAISSRAEISSTRFVNEYNFGDFKGDADEFLHRWFDAHVYFVNWGTYRFCMALPGGRAEAELYSVYLPDDLTSFQKQRIVLHLERSEESPDYIDDEEWMERLLPLRNEVLSGDLRPLYLGWLAAIADEFDPVEGAEPPIPAGLKFLSPAQESLVEFLRIPDGLVKLAADESPRLVSNKVEQDVQGWVKAMKPAALRKIVTELMTGDPARLKHRLSSDLLRRGSNPVTVPGKRTAAQLMKGIRNG